MLLHDETYRMPLCPYLCIGNGRAMVHLDAYGVPQSLQWPEPGSPDRLAWRDPADEWPYWDEMDPASIQARMPCFQYRDGSRDYLHDAVSVEVDYLPDSNVLHGRYVLPRGTVVEITSFVLANADVWVRRMSVAGDGTFVHQSEFFEKAVRGHSGAYLGNVHFRGIFDAAPHGIYVILSDVALVHTQGRVEIDVTGRREWTLYMSMAPDLKRAVAQGTEAMAIGVEALVQATCAADRAWLAKARKPTKSHPFILKHYRRWLLSNRLHLGGQGAMAIGPRPFWKFVWPRDSAFNCTAFAAAGYPEEAQRLIQWNLENTPDSGIHEARYFSDGSPVLVDNRLRQGDNPGFLAWAASFVLQQQWDEPFARRIQDKLFLLADTLVRHVDAETSLPYPEADYFEGLPAISISIVVSAIGGLLGVAGVAARLGETDRAARYRQRAQTIDRAARQHLLKADGQYFMQSIKPTVDKADVMTCAGVYPFRSWPGTDPDIRQALQYVRRTLWDKDVPESMWFYHRALMLLGMAGIGDREAEAEILRTIERDTGPQGLIPEQLNPVTGHLAGCCPLTTSQSCMLLYAYHQDE